MYIFPDIMIRFKNYYMMSLMIGILL